MSRPQTFAIVGGGICGLAAGILLARHGLRVTIFEAGTKPGGSCATTMNGYTFNDGALYLALPEFLDHAFRRLGFHREALLPMRRIARLQTTMLPDGSLVHIDDPCEIRIVRPDGGTARTQSDAELGALLARWMPVLHLFSRELLLEPFSLGSFLRSSWRHLHKFRGTLARELQRALPGNDMKVLNIHERTLNVPAALAGTLIDSLSSNDDRLWPHDSWPPMRFDQPLGIGATGGHGPVRYSIESYERGKHVCFKFLAPKGFHGFHAYELVSDGRAVRLRHVLEMNTGGAALVTWPLVFRPLHDALIEDSLARAEASLGLAPTVQPWSWWTKMLRWLMSGGRARKQVRPAPMANSRTTAAGKDALQSSSSRR